MRRRTIFIVLFVQRALLWQCVSPIHDDKGIFEIYKRDNNNGVNNTSLMTTTATTTIATSTKGLTEMDNLIGGGAFPEPPPLFMPPLCRELPSAGQSPYVGVYCIALIVMWIMAICALIVYQLRSIMAIRQTTPANLLPCCAGNRVHQSSPPTLKRGGGGFLSAPTPNHAFNLRI